MFAAVVGMVLAAANILGTAPQSVALTAPLPKHPLTLFFKPNFINEKLWYLCGEKDQLLTCMYGVVMISSSGSH